MLGFPEADGHDGPDRVETGSRSVTGNSRPDPVIQDIESIAAKRTFQIDTAPE
jgi:hypothetical protein